MELQVNFNIPRLPVPIRYGDRIMLSGSCFTEHIGNALSGWKFNVLQNPNGILFDPESVSSSLISYTENKPYTVNDLFFLNELWQSWQHHSRFSHIDRAAALQGINESLQNAHEFLKKADWLIITLGSTFSYRLKKEINNKRAEADDRTFLSENDRTYTSDANRTSIGDSDRTSTRNSDKKSTHSSDKTSTRNSDIKSINDNYGTSFIDTPKTFTNKKELAVANCHRAPAQWFTKHLLEIDETIALLDHCYHRLRKFNPALKIMFTISPVRHLRDGVVENNRSKARLIEAVHHMINKFDGLYYFPAYELVTDVLRDYRFYDVDMAHPNYLATSFVLEKFTESCIDASAWPLMKEVKKIQIAKKHRSLFPGTVAHKDFLTTQLDKTLLLQQEHEHLDMSEEINYFREALQR